MPSILPMTVNPSLLGAHSTHGIAQGSWQYQPQGRNSSVQLYRCWQTRAVDGHPNEDSSDEDSTPDGACCVSFEFDIMCEFSLLELLFVVCLC